MSGIEHWLSGSDSMSGALMLLLWAAGVVTALVVVIAIVSFRDFAARETVGILLRTAVVIIIAAVGWTWLDYSILRERFAERRALDARANELTARAIAPGSALACLNTLDNEAVETACEQAVFVSPQTVAAAVAYVEARLALLADGIAYAGRDRNYAGELERPRRVLEADRFGIVAHVLAGRGCTPEDCAAFKLLKDASRVQANLKERTFEARVTTYAAIWAPITPATAASTTPAAPAIQPLATLPPPSASSAVSAPNAAAGSKYNFPSSASIPPISIMAPEPTGSVPPNASEKSAAPPAGERPARRQTATKPPPGPAKQLPPPPRAPPTAPSQGASPNPQ